MSLILASLGGNEDKDDDDGGGSGGSGGGNDDYESGYIYNRMNIIFNRWFLLTSPHLIMTIRTEPLKV